MIETGKKISKIKIITISIATLVLAVVAGFLWYVNDDYSASEEAFLALKPEGTVTVSQLEDGTYVFSPEEAKAALIFYPGGKVEYEAYAPLMSAYAKEAILCILPQMPFELAVFDVDAAERYRVQYPKIEAWYIGGHSLGGAMAASYLAEHMDEYQGLILLAAYSTVDLKDSGLGAQKGDGKPEITNEEQIEETVNFTVETIYAD